MDLTIAAIAAQTSVRPISAPVAATCAAISPSERLLAPRPEHSSAPLGIASSAMAALIDAQAQLSPHATPEVRAMTVKSIDRVLENLSTEATPATTASTSVLMLESLRRRLADPIQSGTQSVYA